MKCQMTVHEIQKGDTLYKLAKQYKTTVPLILLANPGVNPYNLRVGDKLNICEGKRFEEKQGLDELQIVSDFMRSLSARRAWIEISPKLEIVLSSSVALRKENMDRNYRTAASTFSKTVALRKESMECFSF